MQEIQKEESHSAIIVYNDNVNKVKWLYTSTLGVPNKYNQKSKQILVDPHLYLDSIAHIALYMYVCSKV
jgi:hypothetical protein